MPAKPLTSAGNFQYNKMIFESFPNILKTFKNPPKDPVISTSGYVRSKGKDPSAARLQALSADPKKSKLFVYVSS